MSEELTLNISPRTGCGKGMVRKLRRENKLPGVVYQGTSSEPIMMETLEASRLVKYLHGGERMVTLNMEGKIRRALLKEVQRTPTGNHLLHIDFQEVDMDSTVNVAVEIHPIGQPLGAKFGGVLQVVKHEVLITCLPDKIPASFEVNVETLQIGDSMHVKDLVLPNGVEMQTDGEETLIVISPPTVEEAVDTSEEEEAAVVAPAEVQG